MKKKICTFMLCVIMTALLLAPAVSADTGPKPSIRITFKNMSDEMCYGTLLSKYDSTGPASAWDGDDTNISNDCDIDIWKAFASYKDSDNYYFLQRTWNCSETKELNWTYFPPSPFKILLYYPESNTFISSGIYEKYAFDSYYTVDMDGVTVESVANGDAVLTAQKSYAYKNEILSLILRIILTILLEILIALPFGFRQKRPLLLIVGTNIVTQVTLNVLLNVINYNHGSIAFVLYYVLFELIVFAIEAILYTVTFNKLNYVKFKVSKIVLYALTANIGSFAIGLLIAKLVPGIF